MATKKAASVTRRPQTKPTQREVRRAVEVGPKMTQVSSAAYWWKSGHFANEDEARGAFKLAYQQGLDGMGTSIADWMGITSAEYNAWMTNDALPGAEKRKKR